MPHPVLHSTIFQPLFCRWRTRRDPELWRSPKSLPTLPPVLQTSMYQGQLEHYTPQDYLESVHDLQSSNQVVQKQAARVLAHWAERKDSLQLTAGDYDIHIEEFRVISRLVQLLHSSSSDVKLYAAEALARKSAVSKFVKKVLRQQIAEVGAIPRLIQLLQSKLPRHVAAAALTLAHLASDDKRIQQQIAAVPGAIPALKQLLDNMHQDVPQLLSIWSNRQAVRALINRIAGTAMPGDSDAPEPKQLALNGGTDDRPCCKDSLGESLAALCSHTSEGPQHSDIFALTDV